MGCFNRIGFVSSLPIHDGDETILILMLNRENNENSGVVYPHDLYSPMFLPLIGKYDDYGKIDNIKDTPIVKYIENFFGEDIYTIIEKVDDNSVGRGDIKTTPKNEDIFKLLTFGLEHLSVYDKLSKEFNIENVRLNLSRGSGIGNGNDIRPNGTGFIDDFMAKYLAEENGIEYVDMIDSFINLIGEPDIISFLSFNMAMKVLNSKYFPSNYGSQSQDHILHYKMLTLYRNLIVKKLAEYDDPDDVINKLRSEIRDERIMDILSEYKD